MKSLEKLLKRFLLLLIRRLFPRATLSFDPDNWHSFKRILVFRLDSRLGNCVLILPLVQVIKESLPQAQIDVLMSSRFDEIYENHPCINQLISYDQGFLLKRPWRFFRLLRQLRKSAYDVVFSSSNPNSLSLSQAIFARIVSTGRSVGFKWRESEQLYTDVVAGRTDVFYGDAQVDLWRFFEPKAKYQPPRLYFVNDISKSADKDVLFWLGARGRKILPQTLISQIADLLERMNIYFRYAAGPSDQALIKRYSSRIVHDVEFLSGDLRNTVNYFTKFKLLIMPDTGPMHLAAAMDIPLIQIFIGSNKIWYGYEGNNQIILTENDNLQNAENFIDKHIRARTYSEQGKVL